MNVLYNDIYLVLMSYLDEVDQREWCCCKKKWYKELFRGSVRRKIERFDHGASREKIEILTSRIDQVIQRPSEQLAVSIFKAQSISSSVVKNVHRFLKRMNYSILKLSCSRDEFVHLISLRGDDPIHIQELFLHSVVNRIEEKVLSKALFKTSSLKKLNITMLGCDYPLTHIASIKDLTIHQSRFSEPLPLSYFVHLEKLELNACDITDVSMLGSIPELSLTECPNITDISALNQNRKITIVTCRNVSDYSQSFAESEVIYVNSNHHNGKIPFQHWKKVKSLRFLSFKPIESTELLVIPHQVLRCSLEGLAIPTTSLMMSPTHMLRELTIHLNDAITSVENLGWEQLVVIKLYSLERLMSLNGLGLGQNQKIVIHRCPLITDYSPLRNVHEVIINTEKEVNLDELDQVHTLTITASKLLVNAQKLYDRIQKLDIRMLHTLSTFQGLQNIPYLIVHPNLLYLMIKFLETRRKLWTGRVDIWVVDGNLSRVELFYHRFLTTEYTLTRGKEPNSNFTFIFTLLRKTSS